ncbi:MAG: hypothetical protein LPJ91_09615 [Pseudazoarcus pumilus]|nr:hypothetical protein [Pseudazoarcus pumilus]
MDKIVILFLFGALLFASPWVHWWASGSLPWYVPYVLWALVIALIAVVQRRDQ